jgi:hypothetical protein
MARVQRFRPTVGRKRTLAACVASAILVIATAAQAAPTVFEIERAKVVASEGLALFDKGEFQNALDKLEQAQRIADVPTIGLYVARCKEKLGRLVDARASYEAVAAFELPPNAAPQWAQAKADAATELAAVKERTPILTLDIRGLGARTATVKIDGVALEKVEGDHPVDPGAHLVEVSVGSDSFPSTIEVAERERKAVHVDVAPAKATAPTESAGTSLFDVLGWTGVGVGGAMLVVWAGTGGAALAKASDLGCDGATCQGDVGDLGSLRTASAVGFWVGLPLALGGASLLVVPRLLGGGSEGAAPAAAAVEPIVGPGFVGVRGTF